MAERTRRWRRRRLPPSTRCGRAAQADQPGSGRPARMPGWCRTPSTRGAAALDHAPAGRRTSVSVPGELRLPAERAAARTLLDEVILPRVAEQMPDPALSLVGRHAAPWLRAHGRERHDVEVTGAVPSVQPWLQIGDSGGRPAPRGRRHRFKVLEAMARGVPVISTPKGVEGPGRAPRRHVLVGDDPGQLVEQALRLWDRPRLAARIAAAARATVEARYSQRVATDAIAAALGAFWPDRRSNPGVCARRCPNVSDECCRDKHERKSATANRSIPSKGPVDRAPGI